MAAAAQQSADRAAQALEALEAADDYAIARAAWEDFLTHWRRGLNRCDAEGKQRHRKGYVPAHVRVEAEPPLAYLWAARNCEEHGIAEIAGIQERAFAIGAFGGYDAEEGEPGPNGERTMRFTPQSDDPPPFFAVLPEHLKLEPITDWGRVVPVPSGFDYDLGETPAAVALATVGLDFLRREVVNLIKLGCEEA